MTRAVPEPEPEEPAVELRHVTHRCDGASLLLDDVSLRIGCGEMVLIAGPNGSGKTTLLRHLNGLLHPSAGEVRIHGRPVRRHLAWTRQQVGMVFQEPDCQIVGESVTADVAFGPENLRLPRPEIERRVSLALADVGLQGYETRHPHELSGGEKRRLAIAGVLALQPSVVALDEPLANLDYPGMLQLLEQIRRLHATGHTQLVATHELEPLIDTADRLVMLHRGRVVWDGPPREGAALAERFGVRPLCGCRRLWPAGGAR